VNDTEPQKAAKWVVTWFCNKCEVLKAGQRVFYKKIGDILYFWNLKTSAWNKSYYAEIPSHRILNGKVEAVEANIHYTSTGPCHH